MKIEFIAVRSEMKEEFAAVQSEMKEMGREIRSEMKETGQDIRSEIQHIEIRLGKSMMKMFGTSILLTSAITSIISKFLI